MRKPALILTRIVLLAAWAIASGLFAPAPAQSQAQAQAQVQAQAQGQVQVQGQAQSQVQTQAQVTLRWGTGQGGDYLALFEELAARYERETGVKVEVVYAPYDELRDKVIIGHAIGEPIDIFDMHSGYLGEMADRGVLMDLGPYLEHSTLVDPDEFFPPGVLGNEWLGKQVGMPIAMFFDVLYYNAAHFAEAGLVVPDEWDWAEFADTLQKLVRRAHDGTLERTGLQNQFRWNTTMAFIYQAGGDFFDETNQRAILDQPPAIEAVSYLKDLHDRGLMISDGFREGKTALFLGGSWDVPALLNAGFDFGVVLLPRNKHHGTRGSNLPIHISSITKYPQEAWRFVEYILSPTVQSELNETVEWLVPAWTPAAQEFARRPSALPLHKERLIQQVVLGGRIPPRHSMFSMIEGYVNQTFAQIIQGLVPVEVGLAELTRQINAVIGADR